MKLNLEFIDSGFKWENILRIRVMCGVFLYKFIFSIFHNLSLFIISFLIFIINFIFVKVIINHIYNIDEIMNLLILLFQHLSVKP